MQAGRKPLEGNYRRFYKGESMIEWISVKNQLPERKRNVLCATNKKTVYVNSLDIDGYWFYDNSSVTHWMPLPEPPKQ